MMTRRFWTVLGVVILAGLLVAPTVWRGLAPAGALAAEEEHSEFDEAKDVLDRGMKTLRRSLRKEDWERSLETTVEMQKASMVVKDVVPPAPRLEALPESERPKFLVGYRKEMAHLMMELLTLEVALLDQDAEAADASYERLKEMKEVGHDTYAEEES